MDMDNELTKLRETHSNLLANASDLELDLPDHLVVEFHHVKVGQRLCKELHDLVEKGRHTASLKPKEAPIMAKKAKKKVVKKAAKKAVAKKRANGFPEDAKIKVLIAENPTRKGSGRFERVAKMLKSNGKTVEASGVKLGTLRWGIDQGLVAVG